MSIRTVPATLAAVMFMALGFPAADAQPKPQPPQSVRPAWNPDVGHRRDS